MQVFYTKGFDTESNTFNYQLVIQENDLEYKSQAMVSSEQIEELKMTNNDVNTQVISTMIVDLCQQHPDLLPVRESIMLIAQILSGNI